MAARVSRKLLLAVYLMETIILLKVKKEKLKEMSAFKVYREKLLFRSFIVVCTHFGLSRGMTQSLLIEAKTRRRKPLSLSICLSFFSSISLALIRLFIRKKTVITDPTTTTATKAQGKRCRRSLYQTGFFFSLSLSF